MRKLLLAALAALLVTSPAGAVVNGEPDGTRHPYVVALGFLDPATGARGQFCTGTLVSPTVVVTAGHCTASGPAAVVWSGPVALAGPPNSMGMSVTHPDFKPEISPPNTGDLGVVLLRAPILLPEYGKLPTAGHLDNLAKPRGHNLDVTFVGYGAQSLDPFVPPGLRMVGTGRIKNLNNSVVRDYGVKISGVNGSGRAGLCIGDSGAPILHGDSSTIVAVHSFGDVETCEGATYSYRLDSAAARSFLGQFVALP